MSTWLREPLSALAAAAVATTMSCAGARSPAYVKPVLENRQEISNAMRTVGAGLEGEVVLQMRVDEQGRVQEVKIIRASSVKDLDDAALWIAEMMRFEPARTDGRSVSAWLQMPLTFRTVAGAASLPRLRNGPSIAAEIADAHPELEGLARFRVLVAEDGSVRAVRDRRGGDPEVRGIARGMVERLEFAPAYRDRKPVDSWIDVVFEIGDRDVLIYIDEPQESQNS